MGKAKMENEIWEEIFGNWGAIFARESYQESIVCGVCGNDKSKVASIFKKGKEAIRKRRKT